jgi:uncharacterized protein YggE
MKKSIIGITSVMLLMAVLSGCAGTALPAPAAAAASTVRTINVSGQGLTYITPDVAYVYIGVHSQSESVADALQENNAQATAVTEALKEMGVDATDIQTTNFNVYPMQTYGQQGEITGTTYSVDNTVYVTIRKLDQLGKLLDTVVKSGANSINGITFDVVEKEEALASARKLAIENARKQAEEIAAVTGVTLGQLVSINIDAANPPSMYDMKGMGGGAGAPSAMTPVSAGQMVITANAYLSYEIK